VADRARATSFVYLDTVPAVEQFTSGVAGVKELALDTEGASFHRFVDRIYLLQLSTRDKHAVIDPIPIGTPAGLGRLLEDPGVEVVFHDADYDLRLLEQDYGWKIKHIFDTRIAAQLLGYSAFGLAALLDRFFGVKLDKKHQRADWSMRPLTPDMLDYAAQDTRYLLELKDKMSAELEHLGRMGWAREEFALLEGTRWADEDPTLSFLKLKGARDLSRRELAVLRELVPWREGVARQMDRATFRVLGNEQLFDIARTQPQSRDALSKIKGMPRGILEQRGNELLDAVRRALAVPEAELPKFPKATRWDRDPDFDTRVSALKTARDEAAKRLALDPGVLCSRDRMEAVARRNPATVDELMEVTELRRWQAKELAEAFVAALAPHRKRAGGAPNEKKPPRAPKPKRATSEEASPYKE
jgi:ribonuclease D